MVTRTELTKRVEILEAQIISQTNLTEKVTTLEAKVSEIEQKLQNLSNTVNVFGASLADLTAAKATQKRTKQK